MQEAAATVPKVRVFFDIDATLLLTDGAGRAAIGVALEAVYGTRGPLEGYEFHGKTDPQIVLELMGAAGLKEGVIRARLAEVWPVYLERLGGELAERRTAGRIKIMPGVEDLLAELAGRDDVALGLLTGNIEAGAKLKLAAAGLPNRFDVGGFGSDSEVRLEIARIAVERGRLASGAPREVIVVGDTPEDVACAHAVGGRAVAVATGRHGVADLEAAGAEAVFSDLSDTEAVTRCIMSGLAGNGGMR